MQELDRLDAGSMKGALEAMLLASSDPVSATDLAGVLGAAPGEVASALADLAAEYSDANRGLQLREVAGGWRLFTHPAFHDQVEALVMSWDTRRLSQAALETLAVIAYHQPVTREGVKAIRGVNSDGVISSLVDKGLVREAGRDPGVPRALRSQEPSRASRPRAVRPRRGVAQVHSRAPVRALHRVDARGGCGRRRRAARAAGSHGRGCQ